MSNPGTVVFLDIDGPMIPGTMYLLDLSCSMRRLVPATTVAVINTVCERSGARIVLNTTHNMHRAGVWEMREALIAQGVKADWFHPTDSKTNYPAKGLGRLAAVNEWLGRHPEVHDWVAFDDSKFTDDERLILVDPEAGLHLGHCNAALERLGGKQVLVAV